MFANPREELIKIFKFMLDLDDLEGTNCLRRIDEVVKEKEKSRLYNLKPNTGDFKANLHLYTPAQIEFVKEVLGDHLYFFGYSNHPTHNNPTQIFKFEEHSEHNLEQYYKFKQTCSD